MPPEPPCRARCRCRRAVPSTNGSGCSRRRLPIDWPPGSLGTHRTGTCCSECGWTRPRAQPLGGHRPPSGRDGRRRKGAVRIGIVCPYSFDVPGGVQNHVMDLAETLISLGHEVSVLAPAEDESTLPPYVVSAGRSVPVPYNGSI